MVATAELSSVPAVEYERGEKNWDDLSREDKDAVKARAMAKQVGDKVEVYRSIDVYYAHSSDHHSLGNDGIITKIKNAELENRKFDMEIEVFVHPGIIIPAFWEHDYGWWGTYCEADCWMCGECVATDDIKYCNKCDTTFCSTKCRRAHDCELTQQHLRNRTAFENCVDCGKPVNLSQDDREGASCGRCDGALCCGWEERCLADHDCEPVVEPKKPARKKKAAKAVSAKLIESDDTEPDSSTTDYNSKVDAILALPPTGATTPPSGTIQDIPVHQIQTDRTQSRAAMDEQSVDEYATCMEAGDKFPAAVVFRDEEQYWLADGFHRLAAAKRAQWNYLKCEVRQGGWRDALKYSLASNQTHGVRRTNADKHHAVKLVLADSEWQGLSNHIIADMCGVSHPFVAKVRAEFDGAQVVTVTTSDTQPDAPTPGANGLHLKPSKRVGRDGKSYPATQPPPSPDAEDPDFDYPDDADEFDPVGLEAELQQQATQVKAIKSGTETHSAKLKKAALLAFGRLQRLIDEMKIDKQVGNELEEIHAAIEAWGVDYDRHDDAGHDDAYEVAAVINATMANAESRGNLVSNNSADRRK